MTNAQIIFQESIELLKQGILKPTGNKLTLVGEDGREFTVDEPEEIHTFNGWKSLGYQVRKGEKAVAKFPIWKCKKKKDDKEENAVTVEVSPDMFMKYSAWFTAAQVDPIK